MISNIVAYYNQYVTVVNGYMRSVTVHDFRDAATWQIHVRYDDSERDRKNSCPSSTIATYTAAVDD